MNITNIADPFINGTSPLFDQTSDSNPYFSTTTAVAAGALLLGLGGPYLAKKLSERCPRVAAASNAVVAKTKSAANRVFEASKSLVGQSHTQLAIKEQILEATRRIKEIDCNNRTTKTIVSLDQGKIIETLSKPNPFYEIEVNPSNALLGAAIQVVGQLDVVKNLPLAIEKKLSKSILFPGGITKLYENNKKKFGNNINRLNALINIGTLLRKSEISSEELDGLLANLKVLHPESLGMDDTARGKINQLMVLLELKQCLSAKRITTEQMNALCASLRRFDGEAFQQVSKADTMRAVDILSQLLSPQDNLDVEIVPLLQNGDKVGSFKTGKTQYRIYPLYKQNDAGKNVRTATLDKELIQDIEEDRLEPYKIVAYVIYNIEDPRDAAVIQDPGSFFKWTKWDLHNRKVVSTIKTKDVENVTFNAHEDVALMVGKKVKKND